MKIVIAPDSFKGNLSAGEVCAAIEEGIHRANPAVETIKLPLADGGEGTARALTLAAGGRFVEVPVTGPLGDPVTAVFGLIHDGKTVVLDLASASGIELIPRSALNPMKASTWGTGELIAAALNTGARELIIGIGGSATNDGGMGMLAALGFRLLDGEGRLTAPGAENLMRGMKFDASAADPRLKKTAITVACDVTNPLLGPQGASAVFGPQKGADEEMVKALDQGLMRLGQCWINAGLADDLEHPGDGAAGGTGAALRICLGARIESGAMLVMKHAGFFEKIRGADLMITGEGMTDSQTAAGKLCSVAARESRRAGVPAALLSGGLEGDLSALFEIFDYAVSISAGETSLEGMIAQSRRDLVFAAENLIRALRLGAKTWNVLNREGPTGSAASSSGKKTLDDLRGMTLSAAKEYIAGFISTIKLNEKKIAGLEEEADRWQRRVELAQSRGETALAWEAERKVREAENRASLIRVEAADLREQAGDMVRRLPGLSAGERRVDPDLLLQEIIISAGLNPGDGETSGLERQFAALEKEAAAGQALASLKEKLARGSGGSAEVQAASCDPAADGGAVSDCYDINWRKRLVHWSDGASEVSPLRGSL
ncbi:MAG: glycerate kinase [Treponema sp.]|jgi:glycerate kinase|nr:glycerate kinase [Treponema sp.]